MSNAILVVVRERWSIGWGLLSVEVDGSAVGDWSRWLDNGDDVGIVRGQWVSGWSVVCRDRRGIVWCHRNVPHWVHVWVHVWQWQLCSRW